MRHLLAALLLLLACSSDGTTTMYNTDAGAGFLPDGAPCPDGTHYCDPRGLSRVCNPMIDWNNCGRCGNRCPLSAPTCQRAGDGSYRCIP